MKKIGISTYLNTQPVLYPLQKGIIKPPFRFIESLPHECSQLLLDHKVDAALIPSIEYARGKDDLHILDTFCISSKNHVKSVELFFKKDLKDLKTVALDTSSRTSVVLTKIILEEKFGLTPEYIPMAPDINAMFDKADAALIIADNALELYDEIPQRFDLAEEWVDFTGLPFVFAFVAGYEDSIDELDILSFEHALEYGEKNLELICNDWHQSHPKFSAEYYQNYLEENISFTFGEEEKQGLNLFYDYAFLKAEIPHFPEFKYFKKES